MPFMKLLHTVSECYTAEKRVHNSHLESGMESKVIILRVLVIIAIFNASSLGATDCKFLRICIYTK